jgi:hypothetical protein
MSSLERRLSVIESVTGTGGRWTANEIGMLAWMAVPSLLFVIKDEAEEKAQRRWLHEHGKVAGRPSTPDGRGWVSTVGDGWHWDTTEDQRRSLAQRECHDLERLLALFPLHIAIPEWRAEPEKHGWPTVHPAWNEHDNTFAAKLARERAKMAAHRGGSGVLAVEWRRQHPDWHRDMTPDEYDVWELGLLSGSLWL